MRVPSSPPHSLLAATPVVAAALLLLLAGLGGCERSRDAANAPTSASATETPAPPTAPAPAPERLESNDGTYIVLWTSSPSPIPENEPFSLEVRVLDAGGEPVLASDAELAVDAAMPEHAHGMNVVPRIWRNNDGTFTATGMRFHMPGRWELYFDVTRGGVTERSQTEVWLE